MRKLVFCWVIIFEFVGCNSSTDIKINSLLNGSSEYSDKNSIKTLKTVDNIFHADLVWVYGDKLFVSSNKKSFQVYNTSNTGDLTFLSKLDFDSKIADFKLVGTTLYTLTDQSLIIYDFSEPEQIIKLGEYDLGENVKSLKVYASHAYVKTTNNTVYFLDISNPSLLGLSGQVSVTSLADFEVLGTSLITTQYSSGLEIFDISTMSSPNSIATLAPDPSVVSFSAIRLENDILVIHTGGSYGKFEVIDVSTITSPTSLSTFSAASVYPEGYLEFKNGYLFISLFERGVLVYDLTNPSSPEVFSGYNTRGAAQGVAHDGDFLYVADEAGVSVLENTFTRGIFKVSDISLTRASVRDLIKRGNYLYLTTYPDNYLSILDVSNPLNPTPISEVALSGMSFSVEFYMNHVFVSSGGDIEVIDVNNPASPTRSYTLNDASFRNNDSILKIDNGHLFAIAGSNLYIYDLSPLPGSSPVLVSTTLILEMSYKDSIDDIAVQGNFIYLSHDGMGMTVYDISNLASPTSHISNAVYEWKGGIYAGYQSEDMLLIKEDYVGAHLFDLSTPSSPSFVSHLFNWNGYYYGFENVGNYFYTTATYQGFELWDNTNKALPKSVAVYNNPDFRLRRFVVDGNYAYAVSLSNELVVLDVSNPVGITEYKYYDDLFFSKQKEMVIGEHLVMISEWGKLKVVDPIEERVISELTLSYSDSLYDIYNVFGELHVVGWDNSTYKINLDDPTSPYISGLSLDRERLCQKVLKETSQYFYCKSNKWFVIIANDMLLTHTLVGTANYSNAVYDGSNFFIPLWGIRGIDVSDPTAPSATAVLVSPSDLEEIAAANERIYALRGTTGITVYDSSNPSSLVEVSTLNTGDDFQSKVYQNDSLLIVSLGGDDYGIIDIRDRDNILLLEKFTTNFDLTNIQYFRNLPVVPSSTGEYFHLKINSDLSVKLESLKL